MTLERAIITLFSGYLSGTPDDARAVILHMGIKKASDHAHLNAPWLARLMAGQSVRLKDGDTGDIG